MPEIIETFKRGAVRALRTYRNTLQSTTKGAAVLRIDDETRLVAMQALINSLCSIYYTEERTPPTVVFEANGEVDSLQSSFEINNNKIVMRSRLSTITLLFLFSLSRGNSRHYSNKWAKSLFSRVYPERYAVLYSSDTEAREEIVIEDDE